MSSLVTWLRRLGFWVGPAVLVGSLLLAGLLVLGGITFYPLFIPALLLLVVPAGGLWLGWRLIRGSAQPRWAKLLALLSPVLGPLLWVLVMLPAPPAHDRLVFLIPAGFRGEVTLLEQVGAGQPLPPADNGSITLRVPANGLLTTSDELESDWLTEAEYYFIDAAGQRLGELPQLDDRDATQHAQPREARPPVGVFLADLARKRLHDGLASSYPDLPASYLNQEAAYLSFTVAPADSLAALMRRPPF